MHDLLIWESYNCSHLMTHVRDLDYVIVTCSHIRASQKIVVFTPHFKQTNQTAVMTNKQAATLQLHENM